MAPASHFADSEALYDCCCMDVDPRLVRHFVELADSLAFPASRQGRHAAQAVHADQVDELERLLGARLFAQSLQGIELSVAGRAFLKPARRMLLEADAAVAAVARVKESRPGSIRLGWAWGSNAGPSGRLVRAFRARCRRAVITLERGVTSSLLDGLHKDEFDAVFVRPPLHDTEGLEWMQLERQAMMLALPEQHRLAYVNPIRPIDLHDDRFVLFPRTTGPGMFDTIAAHLWGDADPKLYVSDERLGDEAVVEAVMAGAGLGLVFEAGTEHRRISGVTYRSLDPPLLVDLALAWRKDDPNPMLAEFLDVSRAQSVEPKAVA
jgi:DNA-binding transcriptional LysR family regulator